ncbi:MAG: biopolymer transporter ExbD [Sphingobacteriales bacterium JAD_PAG50586_3]|nr:MAG: biopolymer transporter ExbD [Sphingobacteriales bacterium JAD_PAG50586_3]
MFRKKRAREMPTVSTAALPDIIFMLLFFFMMTSTIRRHTAKVNIKLPTAQTVEKRTDSDGVCFVYIGESRTGGQGMLVQVNDDFVDIAKVGATVMAEKKKLTQPKQDKFIVSLKIHKDARMKLVKQVKDQLKQVGAMQIDYSGTHSTF